MALSILALTAGCAFEVHSVGPGNGGLGGDGSSQGTGLDARFNAGSPNDDSKTSGADAGVETPVADAGVDASVADGGLDPSTPDAGDPVDPVEPVSCTPATEADDCPGTSCDPRTMQCSTYKLASRPGCWTCVSDSDCERPDHRCVGMDYQGSRFPDNNTGFCMQVAVPLPGEGPLDWDDADDANCAAPFMIVLVDRPSLSGGDVQSYCGIQEDFTTCYAVRSFQNQEACPGGRDDECPAGAFCRIFGDGNKGVNCCTYECTLAEQCVGLDGEPATCGGYCGH